MTSLNLPYHEVCQTKVSCLSRKTRECYPEFWSQMPLKKSKSGPVIRGIKGGIKATPLQGNAHYLYYYFILCHTVSDDSTWLTAAVAVDRYMQDQFPAKSAGEQSLDLAGKSLGIPGRVKLTSEER